MLRPSAQEKKKVLSKILLLIDNAYGHPGGLVEIYNEIHVASMM
jgi:hypothetical protein